MRRSDVEVQFSTIAAPADVAKNVLEVCRLQITPAALVQHASGDVGRCVAGLLAVLEFTLDLAEGATRNIGLEALPVEAVLELDIHRAAESVEPENGVGTLEIDPVDGDVRNEIPVHCVAERLIESDAVDVNGEPLRRSL